MLWLVGAAVFLVRRFWLYFALRRELLENARPVGEVGSIRLIETPAISGPIAFGVFDRVIALPDGFMASRERQQRDLAIEHELAHHRGGDLFVNMAVQPLFAIHWFNPLAYLGWNALRRDQEAFCDTRVGVMGRELAKKHPDKVAKVVTMGSPFSGSPRANNGWRAYQAIAGHRVDEPEIDTVIAEKPPVETVAFWSPRDGIVAPKSACGKPGERDRAIPLRCTHMGFVMSNEAMSALLLELDRP